MIDKGTGMEITLELMELGAKEKVEFQGDDKEHLKQNIAFINAVSMIENENNYKLLDSPVIDAALEHISNDLRDYINPIQAKIYELNENLKVYQNQKELLEDQEHKRICRYNRLMSDIRACGLFDGARKKSLQIQLKECEDPITVPVSITKKIEEIMGQIAFLENNIKPIIDRLKMATFCRNEMLIHCENVRNRGKQKVTEASKAKKENRKSENGEVRSKLKKFNFSF